MQVEFNEFTYAFALLDSLPMVHTPSGKKILPILPSTRAEAKLGYDARLDLIPCMPLFLQFKVCERMMRRSAAGSNVITPPFYRFKLWPGKKSAQHGALLALNRVEPLVYYVAPRFHETDYLAYAHTSGKLPGSSIWVAPVDIGPLPDDLQHHVVYSSNSSKAYFCSDPRPIVAQTEPYFLRDVGIAQRSPESIFYRIRNEIRKLNQPSEEDEGSLFVSDGEASLDVQELNKHGDFIENVIDNPDRTMIQRLEWMVRHYFGCATVLIFDDPQSIFP